LIYKYFIFVSTFNLDMYTINCKH